VQTGGFYTTKPEVTCTSYILKKQIGSSFRITQEEKYPPDWLSNF
jgi:hypothetical protein